MNNRHIFLLSHMRAYTSLISHILGSHEEIIGYYELHQNYLSKKDLNKQINSLNLNSRDKKICYFDKLLHNDYQLNLNSLENSDITILMSCRSAKQTLKSIINLFQQKNINHPYAQLENVVDYYIQRLQYLAEFSQQHKQQYYYYDADLIRTDSENTLAILTQWLSLHSPLKPDYQSFEKTGQERAGDSSKNIKSGKILKQKTDYSNISISNSLVLELEDELKKYKNIIIKNSIKSMFL